KSGHWNEAPERLTPERRKLTLACWDARNKLAKLYRELSQYNDRFEPFEVANGHFYARLAQDKSVEIRVGADRFEFDEWPDFAKYLSGGWFEEYTFMRLQPMVEAGLIQDMRIGLEVSFKEDAVG